MHNLIVEDERDLNLHVHDYVETSSAAVEMERNGDDEFQDFLSRYRQIKDKEAHFELRNALIEHIWEEHGNSYN